MFLALRRSWCCRQPYQLWGFVMASLITSGSHWKSIVVRSDLKQARYTWGYNGSAMKLIRLQISSRPAGPWKSALMALATQLLKPMSWTFLERWASFPSSVGDLLFSSLGGNATLVRNTTMQAFQLTRPIWHLYLTSFRVLILKDGKDFHIVLWLAGGLGAAQSRYIWQVPAHWMTW